MPLERLRRKITTENLWLYILTLLKEKPRYAYEIREEIKQRFGFETGKITSYVVLYRLKNSGYVTKKSREVEGRTRKYYTLTPKGKNLLQEGIKFLEKTLQKVKSPPR